MQDVACIVRPPDQRVCVGKRRERLAGGRLERDGLLERGDGAIERADLLAGAAEILVGAEVRGIQLRRLFRHGHRRVEAAREPKN